MCVMVRVLAGVKEAGLSGCPGIAHWVWASLTCLGEEEGRGKEEEPGGREHRLRGGACAWRAPAEVPSLCTGGPRGTLKGRHRDPAQPLSSLWDTLTLWAPSCTTGLALALGEWKPRMFFLS